MNNIDNLLKQWEVFEKSNETSIKTITLYKDRIYKFNVFMNGHILETSEDDFRKYKTEMLSKYSPRTFNQHRCALVSFFDFLVGNNSIKHNPIIKVVSADTSKLEKNKLPLSLEEVKNLLNIVRVIKRNKVRNIAILEIFSKTGLRVEEVKELKLNQVKDKEVWNDVRVKGGRIRIVDLTFLPEVKQAIDDYIINARPQTNNEYLFISETGNQMSINALQNLVKYYGKKINRPDITPHTFRSTLADSVLAFKGDTVLAQIVIGHKVNNLVVHRHYTNPYTRAKLASRVVRQLFDEYNEDYDFDSLI